jgi:hypothetical protein
MSPDMASGESAGTGLLESIPKPFGALGAAGWLGLLGLQRLCAFPATPELLVLVP